ncbi:unnamed protein product [Boreogadus saida]
MGGPEDKDELYPPMLTHVAHENSIDSTFHRSHRPPFSVSEVPSLKSFWCQVSLARPPASTSIPPSTTSRRRTAATTSALIPPPFTAHLTDDCLVSSSQTAPGSLPPRQRDDQGWLVVAALSVSAYSLNASVAPSIDQSLGAVRVSFSTSQSPASTGATEGEDQRLIPANPQPRVVRVAFGCLARFSTAAVSALGLWPG